MLNLQSRTHLYWVVFLYLLLCASAYVIKGDYYHKQSDQFYYLSLADSLRLEGKMKPLVDLELTDQVRTANTGVTWLMLPFSSLSLDAVAAILVFIHLLLNLSTVYPLLSLLRYFKLSEYESQWIVLLYFFSFPVTTLKLWPVNEGVSFFLTTWFLYFYFAKPQKFLYLPCAFFAPLFRVHILYLEIAALIYAMMTKNTKYFKQALGSLGATLLGGVLYRSFFPYTQQGVTLKIHGQRSLYEVLQEIFMAFTHVFIPETVIKTVFGSNILLGATILGIILFFTLIISLFWGLRKTKYQPFYVFSGIIIFITTLSLFFWLTIIARFLMVAAVWMLAVTFVYLGGWPRVQKTMALLFLIFNVAVAAAYAIMPTTDPFSQQLEDVKALSTMATPTLKVFYDEDFPLHNRQIYGYFRRAVYPEKVNTHHEKFNLLTLHSEKYAKIFKGCEYETHSRGGMTLFNVDCGKHP